LRVVLEYGLMVHRDQAEREAKYRKQCMPHIGYAELILTHIPISAQSHGRSVTALAGEKKKSMHSVDGIFLTSFSLRRTEWEQGSWGPASEKMI